MRIDRVRHVAAAAVIAAGALGCESQARSPTASTDASVTARLAGDTPRRDWSPPVNLGPPINSVDDEFHAALSADGLTFYFAANRTHDVTPSPCDTTATPPPNFGGNDLYSSAWDGALGSWLQPVNMGPSVNGTGDESGPFPSASADGQFQYLYFASAIPGGTTQIFRTRRSADASCWEPRQLLPARIDAPGFNDADPSLVTLNGKTYFFFARTLTPGRYQIQASLVHADRLDEDPPPDDAFEPPQPVNVSVPNFNNTHPTILNGTMIFASNRPGTCSKTNVSCTASTGCPSGESCDLSQGGPDLWMSSISPDDTNGTLWSTPVNLGPEVNTSSIERAPFGWVDPTGDVVLYFASDRPGSSGKGDFYSTRARAASRFLEH